MKFKLIKEINKKKKDFVINNEIQIVIENESIIIKKETFKKIIKNLTDQLEKEFDKIQSYLKQNEITFKSIEIIGEIMRIPKFLLKHFSYFLELKIYYLFHQVQLYNFENL